jgi:hypothetical protein
MHQPIYWPDRRASGTDHYEAAWDTIPMQNAGRAHPSPEVLSTIFGADDRVAAYQYRPYNTLSSLTGYPNAGAQMSYSGALIENIQSLGSAEKLNYSASWYTYNQQARSLSTSSGKPRLDLVNFTYHHALAPLLSDETLEMELRIHQRQMEIFWGASPAVSRGYFPAETCFTERMIPILAKVGITWSVIANNHLARACADFPLVMGSGGENCDPPNPADQLNPAVGSGNYKRLSIERGCSPTAALPFAFQPHYARYVNPATGAETRLLIIPADQALGWRDSYGSWDLGLMSDLAARNNPAKPALALFAHDGDNAWSGGYSYYAEWAPSLASQAATLNYSPSTVEQFLAENPPDTNDVVHVEDGGWVFADGDFGSPIFVNWHWPPSLSVNGVNVVDPSQGTSDKADNWRVIIATENRVKTAQQISGTTPRIDQVRDPGSYSTAPSSVELGWHYYLAGLDSGFVYYGCHDDECQRVVVAQSNAMRNVDSLLAAGLAADTTPPTLFPPQRHPWNPGGTNFGVQYSYRATAPTNTDFWVWTYAYDASGITNVSLKYRGNGADAPTNDACKTYAGSAQTGSWQTLPMTRRIVGSSLGVTPQYFADYYYARVAGITNAYLDYYVSAADSKGNTCLSPIQHVWVGSGIPGSGNNSSNTPSPANRVSLVPAIPTAGSNANLIYYPAGGPLSNSASIYLHLGWNGWSNVSSPDLAMTNNSASNRWEYTVSVPYYASRLDCVFNNSSGVWDNNSSQDWHFAVITNSAPVPTNYPAFVMDGTVDSPGFLLASNGMILHAAVRGGTLYVATWSTGAAGPNDHFIFVSDQLLPAATASAPWAKSGALAVATTKPYLASESQNSYISWFINGSSAPFPCAKSASTSGVMEGALDLVQAFGSIPTNLYLCAAAYITTNGGPLVAQCPSGTGLNIESNEFLAIPTAALSDADGDGVFDRLEPAQGFKLLSLQRQANGLALQWNAMPGRAYQPCYADTLTNPWLPLLNSAITAAPLQLSLSWTDAPPATTAQRFYRIKLLPQN